jgi:glutathione S-transferase
MAVEHCHAGQYVDYIELNFGKLEDMTRLKSLSPFGRVPLLRTSDGDILWESAVIVQYVDDMFSPESNRLMPHGNPLEKALQRCWTHFFNTVIAKSMWETAFATEETLPSKIAGLHRHFRTFEEGLKVNFHLVFSVLSGSFSRCFQGHSSVENL